MSDEPDGTLRWIGSPDGVMQPHGVTRTVRDYLRGRGWVEQRPGVAGALWRRPPGDRPAVIAVASDLPPDSLEFRSVIERLAAYEGISQEQARQRITTWMVDIARLRAVHDDQMPGSILLRTGVELVTAARRIVRAAATTSLRPRGHIVNYLQGGDQIAARARMGHTEEGSFVLPIWMPLSLPPLDTHDTLPLEGIDGHDENVTRLRIPDERRVTRTLAQALEAIDQVLVRPEREPTDSDISASVAAGVSRELVDALARILNQEAVEELEATFEWAPGVKPPARTRARVQLPAEATPRLARAAELLHTVRPISQSVFTGPIVEIRRGGGAPVGEIAIDTVHRKRRREVRVRLAVDDLDRAHDWMRSERLVLVDGKISQIRQGQAIIEAPHRFEPLDETRLIEPH
jgi:hypothetical protein